MADKQISTAARAMTLHRDDGTVRHYAIGDEIDSQDRKHWFVQGVHPSHQQSDKVPAAGSVQGDPDNLKTADRADGPSKDPADDSHFGEGIGNRPSGAGTAADQAILNVAAVSHDNPDAAKLPAGHAPKDAPSAAAGITSVGTARAAPSTASAARQEDTARGSSRKP